MSRPSLRIHVVTHDDGRYTAQVVPRVRPLFAPAPPAGIGTALETLCDHLEAVVRERTLYDTELLEQWLWTDGIELDRVRLEVRPQTRVDGTPVIADRQIPIDMTYLRVALPGGACLAIVPRFGWRFLCESPRLVVETLRQLVGSDLLGESPAWIAAYRHGRSEQVIERSAAWAEGRGRLVEADESLDARFPALTSVAEEWVTRARRGRLAPVMGDALSLLRQRPALDAATGRSVVLVGPSGAGKTALVRLLARALWTQRKERPTTPRLWATSGDRIAAGMVFLGEWQARVLAIVDELDGEPDWLYVDHLASITRELGGGGTIADLLLPAMRTGQLRLLAECTPAEWERAQQRTPGLASALHPVRVDAVPAGEMPSLLMRYQEQRAPTVSVRPDAMRRLVAHLELFDRTAAFPGKGFRFLDTLVPDPERATPRVLGSSAMSEAFAAQTGLPLSLVSDDVRMGTRELAGRLASRVIGQDAACELAARVLLRLKAGLADPARPAGVLLFAGPTGVGKTELCKQIARVVLGDEKRLVRIDMGEHLLPGSARRLIEAGEGVSSLAERVRQQPTTVVLLDEIEKAHPEVYDLLLGVLGEGRLTDVEGRDVDFRGAVIVMTSNLGGADAAPVGFDAAPQADFARRVREHFRPELFARIDEIVPFRELDAVDVRRIVELEIAAAEQREGLARRRITLRVTDAARDRLAALGHEPGRGARALKRVIEERVVTQVALRIARAPELVDRALVVDVGGVESETRIVIA